MRRGQIQQVFLFIMAVIIIIATIILGSKLIDGFGSTVCDANDANFAHNLRIVIDDNSVFGSRNEVSVPRSCDADAVCFVDTAVIGDAAFDSDDAVIRGGVHAGVLTNVYLQSRDATVTGPYDERIILRGPGEEPALSPLCIPSVGGRFTFRTIGHGRYVQIAAP